MDGVNSPSTPNSTGSSGHKNSLKGTKLARRARSFKDDLFEKISQMRTPTNTLGRSHSPHSPRNKNAKTQIEDIKPSPQSLEKHVRDIKNALKYFKDVIAKKKLEVVPGNGTVVLELITSLYAVVRSHTLNENSSTLISATTQVYVSLGKLLKLCDEVLLCEDESECASLSSENVQEVVDLVENAVQNLVNLANEKINERSNTLNYSSSNTSSSNTLRPSVDVAGQRTSLPDIPLTPKERDILEKSVSNPIRTSHSTESILRDSSPPPKPPLPNRTSNPPPLPPKKRAPSNQHNSPTPPSTTIMPGTTTTSDSEYNPDSSLLGYGVDHLSMRSKSPDDNSSLLSASAGSLDSAFNHSREEEELKALVMDTSLEDQYLEDDVERMFAQKSQVNQKKNLENKISTACVEGNSPRNPRHSNESGFASMQSIRASMQSVSTKRSSEQSIQSHKSSTTSNSTEMNSFKKLESISLINEHLDQNIVMNLHQQQHHFEHHQQISASATTAGGIFPPNQSSLYASISKNNNNEQISNSNLGYETNHHHHHHIHHHQQQQQDFNFKSEKTVTAANTRSGVSSSKSSSFIKTNSLDVGSDEIFGSTVTSTSPSIVSNSNTTVQQKSCETFSSTSVGTVAKSITATSEMTKNKTEIPPALPVKARSRNSASNKEKHQSRYDNVEDNVDNSINPFIDEVPEMRHHNNLHHHHLYGSTTSAFQLQSKHQSLIEPRRYAFSASPICDESIEQPPPLPMKKKHIIAYMEICSASTRASAEHQRHSVHTYNLSHSSEHFSPSRNITHSQTMNLSPIRKQLSSQSSLTSSPTNEKPPALPPKKQQRVNCKTPTIITTPPPSPKPSGLFSSLSDTGSIAVGTAVSEDSQGINAIRNRTVSQGPEMTTVNEETTNEIAEEVEDSETNHVNQYNKQGIDQLNCKSSENISNNEEDEGIDVILRNNTFNKQDCSPTHSVKTEDLPNLLEEIDISDYLIFKKEGEDGPDVKGGYLDALIVHATKVQKNSESDEEEDAFGEAFITTFRTFITPFVLIEKLTHRYSIFCCQVSDQKQKAAKETFSLLVRIVNDLTISDLTKTLLNHLVDFVYQLVCSGQLLMAKLLRTKIVEKVRQFKEYKYQANNSLEQQRNIVMNQPTLLDLKSVEIAEQMTLLDAELFQKIEIPEVLLFAKEQCEEKSPNLNKFTEHFNKMSYWARSQILKQDDAKDREKHVIKFIKIMKHLRKMNNYNSYLALLSALDSAPIRRLEWHKTITEGLKEYCALIDSSSSFRVYRQALAETNPPCIPYIGLVLQDLTFVHVGNPDYLREGVINFSKRWQQHNIIVNMKKFKKCAYPFKRSEKIIRFFENFENFFGEEQMWQISENIKPRGRKQTHNN